MKKIFGFLKRNLTITQEEAKCLTYESMVRSNLEYCSSDFKIILKKYTEGLHGMLSTDNITPAASLS
jgi:hypothetical protein